MPVVSSQYWNEVHGSKKEDVEKDDEGLQTMRTLTRNMAYMLKGLSKAEKPKQEAIVHTNFIR